jgi:hypothetical protein
MMESLLHLLKNNVHKYKYNTSVTAKPEGGMGRAIKQLLQAHFAVLLPMFAGLIPSVSSPLPLKSYHLFTAPGFPGHPGSLTQILFIFFQNSHYYETQFLVFIVFIDCCW